MKEKLNYFTALKFLSVYIFRHKRNFVMFYLGWLFDTILAVSMPILFGVMIDEIVYYQNQSSFITLSLVFVVMSVFSCLLYFFIYAQHHYLMNMYTFDIKINLFDHLQCLSAPYLTASSQGDLMETLTACPEECMHFVIRNFIHFINNVIMVTAISFYLFMIRWQIGLIILAAAPFSVWIHTRYGSKIRTCGDAWRASYGSYVSWVFEMLSALRDIRLLGARQKTQIDFETYQKQLFSFSIKSGVAALTADHMMKFTTLAIRLLIFGLTGYFAARGQITIGLLTIIVSFYEQLSNTLGNISRSYLDAQHRIAYIQRIYDLFRAPCEDDWPGTDELKITEGTIDFKNIHFSYSDAVPLLKNVSLHISGGMRFALAGKSGSGKTTIAQLLLGFYQPQHGSIIIDGQQLEKCSLKSIRQNIGYISQDVLIFAGTLRDNLLLGNRRATELEIETACRQAGLWEFIQTLPDGLCHMVHAQGSGLSGGQKQRLAIARIYLKNPPVIIFDEATSALDAQTEKTVHDAWTRVLLGRTAIVIAHRHSAVMLCHQAAVVADGKIAATGAPDILAEECCLFQSLFSLKEALPDV